MILTSIMLEIAMARLSPRLFQIYTSICGNENLCSGDTTNHLNEGQIPLNQCPDCTCSQSFQTEDPQCPDISPHAKCFNISVLSASTSQKRYFMYGFDQCNEDTNLTKQDLCSNTKLDFLNSDSYPVKGLSNGTWLIFRNQHCADCNNATNL